MNQKSSLPQLSRLVSRVLTADNHWVNARSGVVTAPGQLGSFENGAGTMPLGLLILSNVCIDVAVFWFVGRQMDACE